jgi:integrase/recombinase XerD
MMEFAKKMREDLILTGMVESTQESYIRAVRQLEQYTHKRAGETEEEQLRDYFLYLVNIKKFAPDTLKIAYYGIRFYYTITLEREWRIFDLVKPRSERKLPVVLSSEEVRRMLAAVKVHRHQAFLTTTYSCGLRLQEALNLHVADVSSDRMMIHIRNGKGAKHRYVPLPTSTLIVLRRYWATHRNNTFLFPAVGRKGNTGPFETKPMSKQSVQRAIRSAVSDAGIRKNAHIHTLRHSYATHLLEQGVSLKIIQDYLGHANIQTTLIYVHLTRKSHDQAYAKIEELMSDL